MHVPIFDASQSKHDILYDNSEEIIDLLLKINYMSWLDSCLVVVVFWIQSQRQLAIIESSSNKKRTFIINQKRNESNKSASGGRTVAWPSECDRGWLTRCRDQQPHSKTAVTEVAALKSVNNINCNWMVVAINGFFASDYFYTTQFGGRGCYRTFFSSLL